MRRDRGKPTDRFSGPGISPYSLCLFRRNKHKLVNVGFFERAKRAKKNKVASPKLQASSLTTGPGDDRMSLERKKTYD